MLPAGQVQVTLNIDGKQGWGSGWGWGGGVCVAQGVTKRSCLSWLTNSALVYEPKCRGGGGGGGVAGSQPMSTAVHRSVLNLWCGPSRVNEVHGIPYTARLLKKSENLTKDDHGVVLFRFSSKTENIDQSTNQSINIQLQ